MCQQLFQRKMLCFGGLALWFVVAVANSSVAEPAHFWVSTSSIATSGPEAPTVNMVNGGIQQLHVWARPATVADGPYHADSNPFKRLQNVSLNLVTDQPIADFLDNSIVVHNPMLDTTTRRFEFVHDSGGGLASDRSESVVLAGIPDRIRGLQGFSITSGSGFAGIGEVCHANDPYCVITSAGSPAWMLASLNFRAVQSAGSTAFFLQVGGNGVTHAGETSNLTSVVFGFDAAGEPSYNAASQRELTLTGDDPDLVVQAFPPPPGDYNRNGTVDAADYVLWRKTLDETGDDLMADGNNNGEIDSGDYDVWRANFGRTIGAGTTAAVSAAAVPEPASASLLILGTAGMCRRRRIAS